jgi:hypothetical protein
MQALSTIPALCPQTIRRFMRISSLSVSIIGRSYHIWWVQNPQFAMWCGAVVTGISPHSQRHPSWESVIDIWWRYNTILQDTCSGWCAENITSFLDYK